MNLLRLSRKGRAVRNALAGLLCLFLLWVKLGYPLPLSPDFQRIAREYQLEPCTLIYISQRADDGWGRQRQTAVGRTDGGLVTAVFRDGSWFRRFWDWEPLAFRPFADHLACAPSPTEPGALYLATDLEAAEQVFCSLTITRFPFDESREPAWRYTLEEESLGDGVFRLQLEHLSAEDSSAYASEGVVWAELCRIFDPTYSHMRCEIETTFRNSAGEELGSFEQVLETPEDNAGS